MKFIKKKYPFIFLGLFVFGLAIGYFTMTYEFYTGKRGGENNRTFLEILKPF